MLTSFIKSTAVILLLIFIAGMSKGVSDTLQFHYPKSVFASLKSQEQYWNPAISWKNKYKDYDNGQQGEAFLFSRSLLVWLTDAWHLAQTIQTLAWALAVILAIRLGYRGSGEGLRTVAGMASFFVLIYAAFYFGFMFLYGWALVI